MMPGVHTVTGDELLRVVGAARPAPGGGLHRAFRFTSRIPHLLEHLLYPVQLDRPAHAFLGIAGGRGSGGRQSRRA
jgi:hypothetical protein